MQEFIKHAYAIKEGNEFFSKLTKEDLLTLYTQLDYVYDLFEMLDIVSIYHKNKILRDFKVFNGVGNVMYIEAGNKKAVINYDRIIKELVTVYTKDYK